MTLRALDFHGIAISQLGLGCASAWGQPWFDESLAISIVDRAIGLGITVFDTGASYSKGNAEPRLGRALKGKAIGNLFVSTKTGTHISSKGALYKDWSRDAILRQIEMSRKNLGIDTIPLVYLHGPKVTDLSVKLFGIIEETRQLKWVRFWGVNSFDADVLEALPAMKSIDVVMPDYNLMRVDREPTIRMLSAAGKMVIGGAALANQVLSPHFFWPKTKSDIWYSVRALKRHRKELMSARGLRFLRSIPGWTVAQVAIAFATANRAVSSCIFGTTRIEHLEDNVKAASRTLPDEIQAAIRHAMR